MAAENAYVLTRPTLAVISPSRPESAKIASSPWDALVPKLRSRLVKILGVPHPGKELFRQLGVGRVRMRRLRCSFAYGLAWEEARVSATGLGG